MDTGLLRTIWKVVEETPSSLIRQKTSGERVGLLLSRIEDRVRLSGSERDDIYQYLCDRNILIQEMALEQVM